MPPTKQIAFIHTGVPNEFVSDPLRAFERRFYPKVIRSISKNEST